MYTNTTTTRVEIFVSKDTHDQKNFDQDSHDLKMVGLFRILCQLDMSAAQLQDFFLFELFEDPRNNDARRAQFIGERLV